MKYIELYLLEQYKIKFTDEIELEESDEGSCVGYEVKAKGAINSGLTVYWCDYANWLQTKIELNNIPLDLVE